MDDAAQDKIVVEANVLGMSVKRITDQLRETEAINDALQDTVHRQDDEISRKDGIIADLSAKLDDAMADLEGKHAALLTINGGGSKAGNEHKEPFRVSEGTVQNSDCCSMSYIDALLC